MCAALQQCTVGIWNANNLVQPVHVGGHGTPCMGVYLVHLSPFYFIVYHGIMLADEEGEDAFPACAGGCASSLDWVGLH